MPGSTCRRPVTGPIRPRSTTVACLREPAVRHGVDPRGLRPLHRRRRPRRAGGASAGAGASGPRASRWSTCCAPTAGGGSRCCAAGGRCRPRACPTTSSRTRSPRRPWSRARSPTARGTSWPAPSDPTRRASRGCAAALADAGRPRSGLGALDGAAARRRAHRRPTTTRRPGCSCRRHRTCCRATPPGPSCAARTPATTWSSGPTWCGARPTDLAGSAAAVLGVAAWLAGHGALAWCAVDRAESAGARPHPGAPGGRSAGRGHAAVGWEEVTPVRDPA